MANDFNNGAMPIALVVGVTFGEVKYASPAAMAIWGAALGTLDSRSSAQRALPSDAALSLETALTARRQFFASLLSPQMADMLFTRLQEQLAEGAFLPNIWGLIKLPAPALRLTGDSPARDDASEGQTEVGVVGTAAPPARDGPQGTGGTARTPLAMELAPASPPFALDAPQLPAAAQERGQRQPQRHHQEGEGAEGPGHAQASSSQLYTHAEQHLEQQHQQQQRRLLRPPPLGQQQQQELPPWSPSQLLQLQSPGAGLLLGGQDVRSPQPEPSIQLADRPRALEAPQQRPRQADTTDGAAIPMPTTTGGAASNFRGGAASEVVGIGRVESLDSNHRADYYIADILQLRTQAYSMDEFGLGARPIVPVRAPQRIIGAGGAATRTTDLADLNVQRPLEDSAEALTRLGGRGSRRAAPGGGLYGHRGGGARLLRRLGAPGWLPQSGGDQSRGPFDDSAPAHGGNVAIAGDADTGGGGAAAELAPAQASASSVAAPAAVRLFPDRTRIPGPLQAAEELRNVDNNFPEATPLPQQEPQPRQQELSPPPPPPAQQHHQTPPQQEPQPPAQRQDPPPLPQQDEAPTQQQRQTPVGELMGAAETVATPFTLAALLASLQAQHSGPWEADLGLQGHSDQHSISASPMPPRQQQALAAAPPPPREQQSQQYGGGTRVAADSAAAAAAERPVRRLSTRSRLDTLLQAFLPYTAATRTARERGRYRLAAAAAAGSAAGGSYGGAGVSGRVTTASTRRESPRTDSQTSYDDSTETDTDAAEDPGDVTAVGALGVTPRNETAAGSAGSALPKGSDDQEAGSGPARPSSADAACGDGGSFGRPRSTAGRSYNRDGAAPGGIVPDTVAATAGSTVNGDTGNENDDSDGAADGAWNGDNLDELNGRWHQVRLELIMPVAGAASLPAEEPLLRLVATDVDEFVQMIEALEAELQEAQTRCSRLETLLGHEHKLLEAVFPRQAIEHMTRSMAAKSATSSRRAPLTPPRVSGAAAALDAVRFRVMAGCTEVPSYGSSAAASRTPALPDSGSRRDMLSYRVSGLGSWPYAVPGLIDSDSRRSREGRSSASLVSQAISACNEPGQGLLSRRVRLLKNHGRRVPAGRLVASAAAHSGRFSGGGAAGELVGSSKATPLAAYRDRSLRLWPDGAGGSGSGGGASGGGPLTPMGIRASVPPPPTPGSAFDAPLATAHRCVTVLFADIVGFTSMCNCLEPLEVMTFLNGLFTKFDSLCDIFGVYKVETIGDCFMAVGGLITLDGEGFKAVRSDGSEDGLHALKIMSFAKAMLREVAGVRMPHDGAPLQLRVGLHSGAVTAGIVGSKMPRFCLFGDTVNTANRMESTCEPGAVHVSAATRALLPDEPWVATGGVQVKGKGEMQTYLWRPPADFLVLKGGSSVAVLGDVPGRSNGGGGGAGGSDSRLDIGGAGGAGATSAVPPLA